MILNLPFYISLKLLYPPAKHCSLINLQGKDHENEILLLDEKPVLYSETEDRSVLRGESIEGTTMKDNGLLLKIEQKERMMKVLEQDINAVISALGCADEYISWASTMRALNSVDYANDYSAEAIKECVNYAFVGGDAAETVATSDVIDAVNSAL